jgi:6-phosphogluconolactonase (cycloisomerase 2 family)
MAMQGLEGFRWLACFLAEGVTLSSVSACGHDGGVPALGYAYVASAAAQGQAPGEVFQYTIEPDGSLMPMSAASVSTGVNPQSIASDPSGHYVYVANGNGTISQFALGTGGALTALTSRNTNIPAGHSQVSIDPKGGFLYVVTTSADPASIGSASLSQFSIGSDGTLAPLTAPVISLTHASGGLTIDSSGRYAYLAGGSSQSGQVYQFSVGSDGALQPLTPATVATSPTPTEIALAPGGQTAYAPTFCIDTYCDGEIAEFVIGVSGALTLTGTTNNIPLNESVLYHSDPREMVISDYASSAYLCIVQLGPGIGAGIYQYTIDSTGGLVQAQYQADFGDSWAPVALRLTESSSASNLYALTTAVSGLNNAAPAGQIRHYTIQSDGSLKSLETRAITASAPIDMTLVLAH